ncbi:MAG: hypothetical protein C4527_19720 [Candidatus Omnitrophota bacterium]|jgi:hypothetical protein|nr:MAG: hypothetical protein C4527_19720 [Candidatus Omnitrophota bacterium]
MLHLYEIGDQVLAKTFMAPSGAHTIVPGMSGEVIGREEIVKRHQVRFENGREVWATSDQIKIDPEFQKKKEAKAAEGKS